MLAVVGESGSGKSVMSLTIMHLLSKSANVVKGSIAFSSGGTDSVDLVSLPEASVRKLRGNDIAMIFQEPMTSMNPVMTCGAQVIEPLMLHKKMTRRQAEAEALLLFEKVRLSDPKIVYKKYPHQLSGGQKQRVMIAMAISCKPALLICDEPTTALDVRVQQSILELLKTLRQSENMGVIFITHDLGLVADMADNVLVMHKGVMVEEGPVKNIFTSPQQNYTRGLLLCRPALHTKAERLPVVSDLMDLNAPALYAELTSGPKTFQEKTSDQESGEILVRVRNLHVRHSSGKTWLGREKNWTDAIKDISFDIYKGETLGLVGESGSGKTTIGRALLGLNKPVSGSVEFEKADILKMTKAEFLSFRKNIQIVFQDPYSSLNPRMMAGPCISEALAVHKSLNKEQRQNQVMDLMQTVGLRPDQYNRYPHAFSGGQRQRIVIARALILSPGFVVFDESVSALDVSVQAQILNLINDLKRNLGFTALFISHDLSVIRYLCDRVMVMEKGRIVETGDVESVYLCPKTDYTRSLIQAIPGNNMPK